MLSQLYKEAISLLSKLIETPSVSRNETETANIIEQFLIEKKCNPQRSGNNLWAKNNFFDSRKPVILLNSHHDTVKPVDGWTKSPHKALFENGKLYGLGSNDAGGALVSLLSTFLYFNQSKNLPFNLIFAASAEEEVSGKNGIESILPLLGKIDVGIVGEPTQMQMATAEKGLMVLDCTTKGIAGHAARNEGVNAIYKALKDIEWLKSYHFPRTSVALGDIKLTVSQINAGTKHNVVPDKCTFVVDVRTTDMYSNQEVFDIIKENLDGEVKARSFRLNSSKISTDHPLVLRGKKLGLSVFGSPTMSDQALMSFPTLKIGPGDSARSHTADEFIYTDEIKQGIETYILLLERLKLEVTNG